jgi:hypothetical protein
VGLSPYDTFVITPTFRRWTVLLATLVLLAACTQASPSSTATPEPASSQRPSVSPSPTAVPTPTPVVAVEVPLAVVTGITNLKQVISVEEVQALADEGSLVLPCGVDVAQPTVAEGAPCTAADEIAAMIEADGTRVALLPPGLVNPATKVLRIAGDGPFGLFGPDLFGDPESRSLDYPILGTAMPDDPALDPAWLAHDASQVWTLTNLGSLCADRGAAYETVAQGRGWDWAFDGGTAVYAAPGVVDPPDEGPYYPVQPVETGNDGVVSAIVRRSDVAIADHECPVMRDEVWQPNLSSTSFAFSVPEALLPIWRDTLGLDVIYLAANHLADKGVEGMQSTLELLDEYGLPRTGLGMDLDEALEPAYVEVAGITVGFVAFNDVVGPPAAAPGTPGVAWLTEANVTEAVGRARDGGAELVVCNPQWWGGAEYHADLWPLQVEQLGWFDAAGCDHVIGSGTHVAGPLLIERPDDHLRLVLASPGNYMFGQGWWQETQEGVIIEATYRGTELVNVRLHPTVQFLQARPVLLDPEGDGRYVLERIWKYATLDFAP